MGGEILLDSWLLLDLGEEAVAGDVSAQLLQQSFISSRLDCCNTLYLSLSWQNTWKLQLVQNVTAQMLVRERTISAVLCQLYSGRIALVTSVSEYNS